MLTCSAPHACIQPALFFVRPLYEVIFSIIPHYGDLSLFLQLPQLLQDSQLHFLYFHKPHRPHVPHLFNDEGPHSIRHIAENCIPELVGSSLERNDQIVLIDLPLQGLDLAIGQPAHLVKDKDQIAH